MRIVFFTWRDLTHPKSGGAEVYTDHVAQGLAQRGHRVTLFTSRAPGAASTQQLNGYSIIRKGSELTCRFHALAWLRANRQLVDLAIDEVNTLPFLSPLVFRPVLLLMFQIAREVWLAEAPPIIGQAGYLFEGAMLRVYRTTPIVTISRSSAASFEHVGLTGLKHIVPIAVAEPIGVLGAHAQPGHLGYVGRLAPSKRIDHIIRAVALARRHGVVVYLSIIGTGSPHEIRRLNAVARRNGVADAVRFLGSVSRAERDAVMATFDVIAMVSLREGWGIAISEAGRFGVPSAVYPVAGLVDSTVHEQTGLVCENCTPESLATALERIISDRALRDRLGEGARRFVSGLTLERLMRDFSHIVETTGAATRTPQVP